MMPEVKESDWKLMRSRLPKWQEAYMERLTREYIALLSAPGLASDKFWALEKRIRESKKQPGVWLMLEKQTVGWDLVRLLKDGVITVKDLQGFSEPLVEDIVEFIRRK